MTLVTDHTPASTSSLSDEHASIVERIARELGDQAGSYELLVATRICGALEIDPQFRGHLSTASPAPVP